MMLLWMLPLFWGCSHNAIKPMQFHFNSDELKPEKIDLKTGSKCPGTMPLLLMNAQQVDRKHVFLKNLGHSHYVQENEFINLVIQHLEKQLAEGKIVTVHKYVMDQLDVDGGIADLAMTLKIKNLGEGRITAIVDYVTGKHVKGQRIIVVPDTRLIMVALEGARSRYIHRLQMPGEVKIHIVIPAVNYAKTYVGESSDPDGYKVIAEAAHLAIWQFVNDPVFQQFVKCQ